MRKYIELVIYAYNDESELPAFVISKNKGLIVSEIFKSIEKERDKLFEEITGFKPIQLNGTRLLDIYTLTSKDNEEKIIKIIYESYISSSLLLEYPYSYINYEDYKRLREKDDIKWKTK